MRIGELAKRAGVGIDTERYYEREGLLPLPSPAALAGLVEACPGHRQLQDCPILDALSGGEQ